MDATEEEAPDTTNWTNVAAIFQAAFHDGNLSNKITWQTVVFISKGDSRDFRGIGIVVFLWKTILGLLNQPFTSAIRFHNVICGLQERCMTATASLKANQLQQLTVMMDAVIYEILL